MSLVEGDEVGEGARLHIGRQGREIGVEVGLELGEEDGELGLAHLVPSLELVDVDQDRAFAPQGRQCLLKRRVCAESIRKRSEEHTSELQSLMRISYAVFCLKYKKKTNNIHSH